MNNGKLLAENEALRLALAFYANRFNWKQGRFYTPVLTDNGERARAALTIREDEDTSESQRRALAFLDALAETDRLTARRFMGMIAGLAEMLRTTQGIDEVDAVEHAAEFFASLVWNKVEAPKKARGERFFFFPE